VVLGVGVALEVGEDQPRPVGHGNAHGAALGRSDQVGAEGSVDGAGAFEGFAELLRGAPDHQPDGVDAVRVGMGCPVAEHAVRLAAASSAAEEHLEHVARQQRTLRPGHGRPGNDR
jgi:hypothetical protein